jgi:hypothetical protein
VPEGGAPLVIASNEAQPFGLTLDATRVYWTALGSASERAAPKAGLGDGGAPTVLAMGQVSPTGVAVDSSNVYFTSEVGTGGLFTVSIAGGTPATFVSGQTYPFSVAVDAHNVYWTDLTAGGSVQQVAK